MVRAHSDIRAVDTKNLGSLSCSVYPSFPGFLPYFPGVVAASNSILSGAMGIQSMSWLPAVVTGAYLQAKNYKKLETHLVLFPSSTCSNKIHTYVPTLVCSLAPSDGCVFYFLQNL